MLDLIKEANITIWDRVFSLPIEYDCFADEGITAEQLQALDNFISHANWIYESKSLVEEYCRESVMQDRTNRKKHNIFSYIKPEFIYVSRDEKYPIVAIMCRYRYDPEHGLAVVFSSDGRATVNNQDFVL